MKRRAGRGRRGGVDEDVDAAELRDDLADHRRDRGVVAGVGGDGDRRGARSRAPRPRRRARSASSPRATSATSAPSAASARADRQSDAPTAARDQGAASRQLEIHAAQAIRRRLSHRRVPASSRRSEMPSFEPFRKRRTALLTTYKRDGTPVATPVTIAVDGDHAFVRTWDSAWKAKRMRNNPAVLVAPATVRGRATGAAIGARSRLLDGEEAKRRRPRDRAPPADPAGTARPGGPPPDALPHAALRAERTLPSRHDLRRLRHRRLRLRRPAAGRLGADRHGADRGPGRRGARARRAARSCSDVQRRIVEDAALERAPGLRRSGE